MSLIGTFLPFCLNNNTYKYESHRGAREMPNKFESLLELLINEENEKAEALFHEIVVEKSRDIYEGLADGEVKAEAKEKETTEAKDEAKDEAKEDDKKEEVKETEKADEKEEAKEKAVDETKEDKPAEEKIKDEGVFTKPAPIAQAQAPVRKSDEESIEEIGGDATDQLVKDIASDEEGEADAAADELGQDMDADAENGENGEDGSVEDRVVDLEDALDELKAEFEAMMSGKDGDEEAEETALAPVIPAQETQPDISKFETKHKEDKKETVKEYKIQKSADNADGSDKSAKSPVAVKGGAKSGANPIKTGSGAEDKGRAAPTAEKIASGGFENSPGKDKGTSFKKEVKADKKDSSDKSAKSPVAGGK